MFGFYLLKAKLWNRKLYVFEVTDSIHVLNGKFSVCCALINKFCINLEIISNTWIINFIYFIYSWFFITVWFRDMTEERNIFQIHGKERSICEFLMKYVQQKIDKEELSINYLSS